MDRVRAGLHKIGEVRAVLAGFGSAGPLWQWAVRESAPPWFFLLSNQVIIWSGSTQAAFRACFPGMGGTQRRERRRGSPGHRVEGRPSWAASP